MKRRINSTGRRRIERRHVAIRLQRRPGRERTRIDADFHLEDLDLNPSANIVLEARSKDFAQRFAWGTVANPAPDGVPDITEVPSDQSIFFRVKAIEPSTQKLLALARRLRPIGEDGEEGGRSELFRVRTRPLGQELWRVVIEDGAPILELNRDTPDVLHDPTFRAAILSAAMRTVLLELRDDEDEDDDPDAWSQRWFLFAADLAGYERPGPDDPEGIITWIDQACSRFAERFALVSAMISAAERRSEA